MAGQTVTKKYILSKNADTFFTDIYEVFRFMLRFFREVFLPPYEVKEIIKQCYQIGYRSLFLISVTAFITGMVFTDHSRPSLSEFGATSWLPALTGIAIVKALAPLISALICAGKTSSQIGAELGSMKVTEQIDAMEVAAVDPFRILVVTRVIATTLMIPLLMLYSAFIGLVGSFINITSKDQTNIDVYIHDAFLKIGYFDLASSVLRSLVFGFTIGLIGCYKGMTTSKGTEGVGRAANSAVVVSMFLVFIEEILIVKLLNIFIPHTP